MLCSSSSLTFWSEVSYFIDQAKEREEEEKQSLWFKDCGRKNVNTWSPEDTGTPGQTDSDDSAPDSAPANRTSPGYTERERQVYDF